MKVLTIGFGDLILRRLDESLDIQLAVAFFSPDEQTLAALLKVPRLTIVISEEFTVNDPYKLEQLTNARLRSIPTDHESGKLHAKVVAAKMQDGSYWALLGSANWTHQGLFANQEANILIESSNPEDKEALASISQWFDRLFETAREPNLTLAKSIFDQRSRFRLEPRPQNISAGSSSYWALKTTSGGPGGEEHWPQFLADGSIAIGW